MHGLVNGIHRGKQAFAFIKGAIYLDKISSDAAHHHFFFVELITYKFKDFPVNALKDTARFFVSARYLNRESYLQRRPFVGRIFGPTSVQFKGGINQDRMVSKCLVRTRL